MLISNKIHYFRNFKGTNIHNSSHHHNTEMAYEMKARMERRTISHRHPEEISHRANYRQSEERQHVFITPPNRHLAGKNFISR